MEDGDGKDAGPVFGVSASRERLSVEDGRSQTGEGIGGGGGIGMGGM